MKINFVLNSPRLTGGTRVIAEIINAMAERGHEMSLLTYGNKSELDWIELKAKTIFVKRSLKEKIIGFLYRLAFGFQPWPEEETRKLVNAMPDCEVNIATISYTGYSVCRSNKGKPYQLHMHYEPLVREDGYKKRIMEECYYLPISLIANSTWVADTIKEKTNRDAVGLMLPAINHSIFYPRRMNKKINKEKIKIVSLAKDKRWKGIPETFMAVKILRDKGYNIDLKLFGGRIDQESIPAELKDLEYTHVGVKRDNELAEFYSEADILISSSFYESFPLPQIEAMACGTAVVTTKYGTEDYAFDGVNSTVVEPKNPQFIADGVARLIEDEEMYSRYISEGMTTAKMFTWERSAEQLEKILCQ